KAVFGSWQNARAITYRRLHQIPDSWGTAVTVQAMVFGNMGNNSATGVAFTRNPSTGVKEIYVEFLVNAQGEDVVAGIRTPQSITEKARIEAGDTAPSLEALMPDVFAELKEIFAKLEARYRDMQDVEFTIQNGKLWMLQTRSGKRTAEAALKIAVDLANEGLITREEAVMRIDPSALDQLLHPTIDPSAHKHIIARGLAASPGAASGEIVFDPNEAEALKAKGREVILVRIETSPEDIHGMHAAAGILTTRGGMTSHAAVVARGMGRACVAGAGELRIDYKSGVMRVRDVELKEGDLITLDGSTGEVMQGAVPTVQPELSGDFAMVMEWTDKFRTMGVRVNCDTPQEAKVAVKFGCEGIGLCRTEHMFFDAGRIVAMREMILADSSEQRRRALDKLLPYQREDFIALFKEMAGRPVTIRLLDPPLHEFLPHEDAAVAEVAKASGLAEEQVRARSLKLVETNPMLGHRGCRLGITYPEIYEMQARAIFEAVAAVQKETGQSVKPEVMIPLISVKKEFEVLRELIDKVAEEVRKKEGVTIDYIVGTMIELPRACLRAAEIAEGAEFFSFGTNDLTQTCFGLSRDDAGNFLGTYEQRGLISQDPFISLDAEGVGELMKIGAERGRSTRPDIKLGICGEHGGDPASIASCQPVPLDYVSCPPYPVPIARLAAAQAALARKNA